jgi:hypothetical protein
VLSQVGLKIPIFPIAEPMDRFPVWIILRLAVGQDDAPGLEEAFHPVIPKLTVHIPTIIPIDIERYKAAVIPG